jgi:hypothetical protein
MAVIERRSLGSGERSPRRCHERPPLPRQTSSVGFRGMTGRSRSLRTPPPRWLRKTYCALLMVALGCAIVLGYQVETSQPRPSWTLGSAAVHKAGVVLVLFVAFYLMLTLLYFAAQGRAFTKFGVAGATAEAPETLAEAAETNVAAVEELSAALKDVSQALADHENRLRDLEGLPELPTVRDE